MKTITKISAAALCLVAISGAYAAKEGGYVGAGSGTSKILTPKQQLFNPVIGDASYKQGGVGGRVFAGYNFNQTFGIEAGVSRYAKSTYKGSSLGNLNSSIEYSMNAIDLVGKAYLPLNNGINLYALGGVARVSSKVNYKNGFVPLVNGMNAPKNGEKTYNKLRPIYGVGASYDIPQSNFTTNLEYSHIQGSGNVKTSASAIPSANMLTLNVAYNFS